MDFASLWQIYHKGFRFLSVMILYMYVLCVRICVFHHSTMISWRRGRLCWMTRTRSQLSLLNWIKKRRKLYRKHGNKLIRQDTVSWDDASFHHWSKSNALAILGNHWKPYLWKGFPNPDSTRKFIWFVASIWKCIILKYNISPCGISTN